MPNRYSSECANYIPTHALIRPLWPNEVHESVRPKSGWRTLVAHAILADRQPGCVLGCVYCNQQWMDRNEQGDRDSGILSPGDAGLTINLRVNFGDKTVKEVSIDQVIELLRNYPLYNSEGSILIGNYTDPGLNWEESCTLASRIVEEFGHSGPILFITKMPVGNKAIKHMQSLKQKGGKVVVIVTYSGMPKKIEPASAKHRIGALRKLHDGGIPSILSMRPMIPEINGTQDNIAQVLSDCAQNTDAIIFGGLFVYPNTQELFATAGHPLPESYANHNYTVAKKHDGAIAEMIRTEAKRLGVSVPVYEHTDCAVSYLMGIKYSKDQWNKLAHWSIQAPTGKVDDFEHCAQICPSCQMKNCVERTMVPTELMIKQIKLALIELRLVTEVALNSGSVEIVQSEHSPSLFLITNVALNVLQLFQIMEKVGVRVDNLPSREQFVMRSFEALSTHLGLNGTEMLGAVQLGQEWVLLVDGDLTNDDNELVTKYVRTTTRCRCNVLNIANVIDSVALTNWLSERKYLKYLSQLNEALTQLSVSSCN